MLLLVTMCLAVLAVVPMAAVFSVLSNAALTVAILALRTLSEGGPPASISWYSPASLPICRLRHFSLVLLIRGACRVRHFR